MSPLPGFVLTHTRVTSIFSSNSQKENPTSVFPQILELFFFRCVPEVLHQDQLIAVELVVPVEHPQLHHHLDQVLDDLLGLFAVAGVLLGDAVQLVQHFAAGVVNEEVGHALGGHLAHQFLLRLQG